MNPYIIPTTAQVAVKLNQQLLQTSRGVVNLSPAGEYLEGNSD